MKKLILITVLVSLVFILGNISTGSVFASALSADEMSSGPSEWLLQTSNGNVDFYYKIDECNGKKAVFLKFVNRNNYKVQISWEELFAEKNTGKNFENFGGEKQLTLSPNATLEASCSGTECSECLILFSMVSPMQVVDVQEFQFQNITVKVSQ